ncbi:type VI secretion system Vgr family protein [Pseudomonas mosselii]|uniref:Type VI secretion system tip protein VgrG n=1 Tax=Pseudomonas mosselii TaxID=78327 RepID=A0AA42S1E6_9PSED|nr:type VI secretion system tip protein TssI/VgrG [Pseudomonas mosselii]MDH1632481.1 type VI secretion system tip protein VgrG [Pseudomonas mosselii]
MPNQSELSYRFEPLASQDPFEVVSFTLDEALSTPFRLVLELVSYEDNVDFAHLLDKPALFTILRGQRPMRYVHGLISAFSQGDTGNCRTRYQAVVEPKLARAGLRSNWRIFQQQSVPQILETLFKAQRIIDFELGHSFPHAPREFCVQAGETDLAFITRLAAEEGFIYRFVHSAKGHRLLISDRVLTLGMISSSLVKPEDDDDDEGFVDDDYPDPLAVLYHANSGGDQARPCLRRLHYREQVRTARQVQRDYSFTHPAYHLQQEFNASDLQHQADDYERFDYPGRYKRDEVGIPFTRTRLTALRHDARIAEVEGDDVRLQPGLSFDLVEHPRADLNMHWRVASVRHEGVQFTSLQEEAAGAEQGTRYTQKALLVPGRIEWRPEAPPKPRIDGPHMATVVGPEGEEIFCDEWGRVKVSFPWDRESRDNEYSSCWVRVSQGWAGGGWGAMAIPRIGQDVVIQYVNADPDQPMITGRTYCGNQRPPYELPKHRTRMTIKSKTHKGQGFNELRFEDELGQEEVFIHAQRDQNNVVKHDETTQVGNDRREEVGHDEVLDVANNRRETIGNDDQVTIGHDALLDIGRSQTTTIAQDRTVRVGNHRVDSTAANHSVSVGGHMQQTIEGHLELKAGQAIRQHTRCYEIHASQSITLKAPGGTLRIDGDGITLDGVALILKAPLSQNASGSGNELSITSQVLQGLEECVEHQR